MNQTKYQAWVEKAFLYVEAALAMELATPSRVCMSEEYLRTAFVRGLSHSQPDMAERVSIEWDAPWTDAVCWRDGRSHPGQGRKVQHDVRVEPEEGANEQGLACEAKWLKQAKAEHIIRDIWKLMLSRSDAAHGGALRSYLLVGGEGDAFQNTMDTLRGNRIPLIWRDDGAESSDWDLERLLGTPTGKKALRSVLSWSARPPHVRTPPACLARVRCVRRGSWYRTVGNVKWRMGIWELTSWGAGGGLIDWAEQEGELTT